MAALTPLMVSAPLGARRQSPTPLSTLRKWKRPCVALEAAGRVAGRAGAPPGDSVMGPSPAPMVMLALIGVARSRRERICVPLKVSPLEPPNAPLLLYCPCPGLPAGAPPALPTFDTTWELVLVASYWSSTRCPGRISPVARSVVTPPTGFLMVLAPRPL